MGETKWKDFIKNCKYLQQKSWLIKKKELEAFNLRIKIQNQINVKIPKSKLL
jgi:hypothetical protein